MQQSRKLILLTAAIFGVVAILFSACKKTSNAATDTGFSTEQATASKTYDDAQSISDQAASTSGTQFGSGNSFRTTGTFGGCDVITHDTVSVPHTMTITFTAGCTCRDGKMRSGSIIVTYNGHYADSGSVHTISFNNYVVNGNKVDNSSYKTVTNLGNYTYKVDVVGAVLMNGATNETHYSEHRIRQWTAGYNTPNVWSDDTYSITNQTNYADTLIRANGNVVTNLITSPILIDNSCAFRYIGGSIRHTFANGNTANLVYDNGCTGTATLTYNGKTYTIQIP
jgi:hypothetical protein